VVVEGEVVRIKKEFKGESEKVRYRIEFEQREGYYGVMLIHRFYYPMWPQGNLVMSTLKVEVEEADEYRPPMLCLTTSYFRDSWYGSGPERGSKVCVDASYLPDFSLLDHDVVEEIENVEDLKNYINELKDIVVRFASGIFGAVEPDDGEE
jgi:hypothetical protein